MLITQLSSDKKYITYPQNYNNSPIYKNLSTSKKAILFYDSFATKYQPSQISFKRLEKNMLDWSKMPRFKMKIAAVSKFQENIKALNSEDIYKQQPALKLKFYEDKEEIGLIHPETNKQLGFIDYEILNYLYKDIKNAPDDFMIKLCSKTKESEGIKNIGLKAHLIYTGNEPLKVEPIKHKFEDIFENKECQKILFAPVSAQPPKNIFETILKFNRQLYGEKKAQDVAMTVENISAEIQNKKNKNILLVGHSSPDGDTLGSVLGMQNFIKMVDKSRKIDCVIDDRIPNLFSFLPGIKTIKLSSKEFKNHLIERETEGIQDERIKIKLKRIIKRKKTIRENKKYDLIIFMDISSPDRFQTKLKRNIDPQKTKIVYIDHHVEQSDKWKKNKETSGIDLLKAKEKNLYWVENRVPAATQMVTALVGKIADKIQNLSWFNDNQTGNIPIKYRKLFTDFAKTIMTGMYTDTGSFSRAANKLEGDYAIPRWDRPNYQTKGLAKWFSEKTNNKITRNFVARSLEQQNIRTHKHSALIKSIISKGIKKDNEIGHGYIEIKLDDFNELKIQMLKSDINNTETDVYGCFKYPYLSKLKKPYRGADAKEKGPFNNDRISDLAINQTKDKIRFSFRSESGTNYASLLGNLFGGGGHDSASGGHVFLSGIDFNTKLSVQINDEKETNFQKILEILEINSKSVKSAMNEEEKQKNMKKISILPDENGKNVHEIISSIINEIRLKYNKSQTH